jgi:hypothetical protein
MMMAFGRNKAADEGPRQSVDQRGKIEGRVELIG